MNRIFSFLMCSAAIYGGTILTPAVAAAAAKDGEPVYTAKCKKLPWRGRLGQSADRKRCRKSR